MRRIMTGLMLGIAAVAATLAMPASAQQRRINVPASATWGHARSGVGLPPAIGDLRRVTITENLPGEVDVSAHYGDDTTRVSIILLRPQVSDVGLWFDVAEAGMGQNPMLRDLRPTHAVPRSFATVEGGVEDAFRQSWSSSGQWTATATAILPVGRWMVKIRASSAALDVTQIDALLDQAIAAIRLPATRPPGRPVRYVAPCAETPRWRRARQIPLTMEDALLGSTGALVLPEPAEPAATETANEIAADDEGTEDSRHMTTLTHPALCRGETVGPVARLYRVPGDDVRYWITFGDAGTYVAVEPSLMGVLGGGGNRVLLTMVTPMLAGTLAAFNRLPEPEQAYEAASTGRPMVTASFDPEMDAARGAPPAPPPAGQPAPPPADAAASPPATGG